jgi:hypothetical protein
MRRHLVTTQLLVIALVAAPPLIAQDHQHQPGMVHPAANGAPPPVESGQAAFAAMAEIVARLDADPTTDWSKVDLERLRQHLIDMDRVTLRSVVATRQVPGGFTADVTGEGETVAAIRRMLTAHAAQVANEGTARAEVVEIPAGVRLTVTATEPSDARAVDRLRGLGVIGFLTLGAHHGPHHEMLARGVMVH